MDPALIDELNTMSEVAATLGGLAAIFGAIQQGRNDSAVVYRNTLLISLLTPSLSVVLLGILPGWLYRVVPNEQTVWQLGFLVFFASQLASFILYFRTGVAKQYGSSVYWWQIPLLPIGLTLTAIAPICALGFFADYHAALYQGSLVFLLLLACLAFGQMIFWNDEPDS